MFAEAEVLAEDEAAPALAVLAGNQAAVADYPRALEDRSKTDDDTEPSARHLRAWHAPA